MVNVTVWLNGFFFSLLYFGLELWLSGFFVFYCFQRKPNKKFVSSFGSSKKKKIVGKNNLM
jgi:hypothetical protein